MLAALLRLQFTAPGDDGVIGRVVGYVVRMISSAGGTTYTNGFGDVGGTAPPVIVDGGTMQPLYVMPPAGSLTMGYAIAGVDDAGNWSTSWSNNLFARAGVPEDLYYLDPPPVSAWHVAHHWAPDSSAAYYTAARASGVYVVVSAGRADSIEGYALRADVDRQQRADSTACTWPAPWHRALVCP